MMGRDAEPDQRHPRTCLLREIGSGATSLLHAAQGIDFLPMAASLKVDSGYATTSAVAGIIHDPNRPPGQFKIAPSDESAHDFLVFSKR